MRMMNRASFVSLALAFSAVPLFAQTPAVSLPELLEQAVLSPTSASLAERTAAFPALAALPADTDSFLAVGRLGELVTMAGGADAAAGMPMLAMTGGLESLALGVSEEAARDLQRLAPLLELMTQSNPGWMDAWMNQAEPAAALAIVAQQREDTEKNIEQLVQYTQDFSLAPIYMVLSAKPEMQMLLHQASMLPLMIPVEPGGPVELTAQGAWRGFCIKGNLVDLSDAGLSPEQEARLKENLSKVQVYVMARVVGNKLVLAITSDMGMVKLPASADKSLLASDKMSAFDGCMNKSPWAVSYTSPGLVNLSANLDSNGYRSVARFVGNVLRRVGKQNDRCARAAVALESLEQSLTALVPPSSHAEKLMVWQDEALFVHVVSDARGYSFAPGTLSARLPKDADKCMLFAESTPLQAELPVMPAVAPTLDNLVTALNGCKATLLPEYAAEVDKQLKMLEAARPGLEKLAAGAEKLGSALTGNTTLLVQESSPGAKCPVQFCLRAGVADTATLNEAGAMLQGGAKSLCSDDAISLHVTHDTNTLLVSSTPEGIAMPTSSQPVQGGMVFSLQLAPLARAVERTSVSCSNPEVCESLQVGASIVERVDGAATTRDGMMHTLLRVQPAGN